ncbi:hypothetical protein PtB15_11B189 [Puccinia triticina]|nr:hypothetical protein PtB15_11B189 [Puccinia triticina]
MISAFTEFYEKIKRPSARFSAPELFRDHHAQAVVQNLPSIENTEELNDIIGGETVTGQLDLLMNIITNFKTDPLYNEHMENQRKRRLEAEELKKQKKREYGAQYRANKQARLLANRQEQETLVPEGQGRCQEQETQNQGAAGQHQEPDTQVLGEERPDDNRLCVAGKLQPVQMDDGTNQFDADEIQKRKNREYAVRWRANKKARLLAEKEAIRVAADQEAAETMAKEPTKAL